MKHFQLTYTRIQSNMFNMDKDKGFKKLVFTVFLLDVKDQASKFLSQILAQST